MRRRTSRRPGPSTPRRSAGSSTTTDRTAPASAAQTPTGRGRGLAADGPAQPLVLIYSDDLDNTLRSVVTAGGTVLAGPDDFPGGRRFHFADPSGNELGVWGPAPDPDAHH
ncbi:MAG TPA: VOC family protein [Streptosporangiaceae bacterium]|nr:VOC family protein [Streptosporangiaceae bacterium]